MKVVTAEEASGISADARLLRRAGIAAIAGAVLLVLTAFLLVVGAVLAHAPPDHERPDR